MNQDTVMQWVAAYQDAWRAGDVTAVPALFTPDASYRVSPYAEPRIGHDAIAEIWVDDELTFTMEAEPVAIDGAAAVVRVEVRYGEPVHQEYRDLWVLRFAGDGRVSAFEEWAYWPEKDFTAETD